MHPSTRAEERSRAFNSESKFKIKIKIKIQNESQIPSEERSGAFNSESPPTVQKLLNAEGSGSNALNQLYLHLYLNMYL